MLKESIKRKLTQYAIGKFEFSGDIDTSIKNMTNDIDLTFDELKRDKNNFEQMLYENKKQNLSTYFSKADVYDDFEGKNPAMNPYNIYDNEQNFKYFRKKQNLSINQLFWDLFYDLKKNNNNFFIIRCVLNLKQFYIYFFLFFINATLYFSNLMFLCCFGIFDVFYYLLFLLFKAFARSSIKLDKKHNGIKLLLFPVVFLVNSIKNITKFILVNCRGFGNLIYSLFFCTKMVLSDLIEETKFLTYSYIIKTKVNRNKRDPEHITVLNDIAKKSDEKMRSVAKHNLQYLDKFEFNEFISNHLDYEKLPDGAEKEYYKELELNERLEIKKNAVKNILYSFVEKNITNIGKVFNRTKQINKILTRTLNKNVNISKELEQERFIGI